MPADPARVQELFLAALDLPDEAARAAHLEAACAGDAELRGRVEALLRAHDRPDSLLVAPVVLPPGGDEPTRTLSSDAGSPASADPSAGEGFELGDEIGRGANGVVFRARQRGLNRVVAVKMALGLERAARHALARFLAEAEAVAAIDHPHVVRVYEFGQREGVPFLAMEYLSGGTLADRLKGGPLDPRAAPALMAKVASGVAAAHALGIVHRDLKPANVLFDEAGEPKVTDFGLARRGEGSDLTLTHAVMGTPAYMAPEQARGGAKFVGPPADVWALGVILYECLEGKRPFEGDSTPALLAQIQSTEPAALRTRVRGVPRDLGTIVAKCLSKEPEHRYPTAAELVVDLGRFVRGEPIAARPVGVAERLARWVRRKPTAAAAWGFSSLAVALALVALMIFGSWRNAEEAKRNAEGSRDEALRMRGEAEDARRGEAAAKKEVERQKEILARVNYGRTIQVAYQHWRDNRIAEARTLLASTRPDLRGWEYDYVHRLLHADLLTFPGTCASFSPDGSKIVAGSLNKDESVIVIDSLNKTAHVWDAAMGKELATLRGGLGTARSVKFGPDGSKVVTVSALQARVWDAVTGKELAVLGGLSSPVDFALFSPDGSKIVTGGSTVGESNEAKVWDARTGKLLLELKGHTESAWHAAFSADGSRIVTGSCDRTARVWDAATGKELTVLTGHTGRVLSASFSPDGSRIVTAGEDKRGRVWDAATGKQLAVLIGHSASVSSAAFSPDGSHIVTSGFGDVTARVWDATTGKELAVLVGHSDGVLATSFSSDGARIVTGGGDGTTRIWDTTTGKELAEFRGHTAYVRFASFSPDGSKVLTASDDGTVRVWDANPGKQPVRFFGRGWTVSGSGTQTVHVYDAATGKQLAELKHTDFVHSASISPDGSRVVTGSHDKMVWVWDANTGKQLIELRGHTELVNSASFSLDGSKVVTGDRHGAMYMWDAVTGKQLAALTGHTVVLSTKFSPDGSRIISGGDGTARVWDANTGKQLLILTGLDEVGFTFNSDAVGATFNSDGSKILTYGPNQICLWDAATGKPLTKITSVEWIGSATFSPDESRILTRGKSVLRLWDTESGAELLALPGEIATFSPDGSRIATRTKDRTIIYDSRPVNRAFFHIAPPPRAIDR
jgi:WD40 repeat protein/tRNA A-37 threonylcarbamoyl transferase component Bud32